MKTDKARLIVNLFKTASKHQKRKQKEVTIKINLKIETKK